MSHTKTNTNINTTLKQIHKTLTKKEFIHLLYQDKRLKFVPNKKSIIQKICKMNDKEFQNFIDEAFFKLYK